MSKKERIRLLVGAIINTIVVGLAIYCLISLTKSAMSGNNKFIYFTNISNLTVGLLSIVNAIFLFVSIIKKRNTVPNIFSFIKTIAISMTTLTFFTVLCLIGPINGFANSYSGRNFFTHLIIPILTLISYLFFEEKLQMKWKYSLLIIVPLAIYCVFYVINVVFLKSWPDMYQINKQGLWYLYLIGFLLFDFALGQGIYFLKKLIDKKVFNDVPNSETKAATLKAIELENDPNKNASNDEEALKKSKS